MMNTMNAKNTCTKLRSVVITDDANINHRIVKYCRNPVEDNERICVECKNEREAYERTRKEVQI